MKKLSILLFLIPQLAWAGLPPPTLQGQAGPKLQSTFNLQVPANQATKTGGVSALIETGNENLLSNPAFQSTSVSASWTAGAGVTASSSSSPTYGADPTALKLVLSSASGDLFYQDATVPSGAVGNIQLEGSLIVQTTLPGLQVCARVGGVDVQCSGVPSSGSWVYVAPASLGGSTSTSLGVSIYSQSSQTGTVYLAHAYAGKNRNTGSVAQAQFIGSINWPTTASCAWSTTSTSFVSFSPNSSCPTPTTTGSLVAPSTKIPAYQLSGGPGTYYIVGSGDFVGASQGYFQFSDGTNVSEVNSIAGSATNSNNPVIIGHISETSSFSNLTFQIQARTQSSSTAEILSQVAPDSLSIQVYYFPSSVTSTLSIGQLPQSWSGYIATTGGASTTSSTFADLTNASSPSLVQVSNQGFGTISLASSELGISVPFTSAGYYYICATPEVQSSASSVVVSLRLVDGNTNLINSGIYTTPGATGNTPAPAVCGIYALTVAGTQTIKLQGAASTGTAFIGTNNAQIAPSAVYWTVLNVTSAISAAQLNGPGTITSSDTSGKSYHDDWLVVGSTCSSSPCTITSQSGTNWLTATNQVVRNSAGNYTVNFATGEFSSAPFCTTTAYDSGAGANWCSGSGAPTTSSWSVLCWETTAGNNVDTNFGVNCKGAR